MFSLFSIKYGFSKTLLKCGILAINTKLVIDSDRYKIVGYQFPFSWDWSCAPVAFCHVRFSIFFSFWFNFFNCVNWTSLEVKLALTRWLLSNHVFLFMLINYCLKTTLQDKTFSSVKFHFGVLVYDPSIFGMFLMLLLLPIMLVLLWTFILAKRYFTL